MNKKGESGLVVVIVFLIAFGLGIALQYYSPGIITPMHSCNDIPTVDGLNIINSSSRDDSLSRLSERNYDIFPAGDYLTESMSPVFSSGDYIVVLFDFTDDELYRIGNVIGFNYKEATVIHRIINIEGNTIYTQGDNNKNSDDFYVMKEDVKFIVIGVFYN